MSNVTTYSFGNVVATIDGLPVVGFFDGDDVITVTPGADEGSAIIGADGSAIFSQSTDESATITFKLQPTSATHAQLERLASRQKNGRLSGFPVTITDMGNAEGGVTDKALIMKRPTVSKGKQAVVREWSIFVGSWAINPIANF